MEFRMEFDYNMGIFGTVKAGKSTIINSYFGKHYSSMAVIRETMTPQTYKFNANNFGNPQKIHNEQQIREGNQQINNLYRTQWDGQARAIYMVNAPPDFINMDPNINYCITDLPGLNDRDQSHAYMQWARDNFHMFDCVILPIDIQARFNSSQDKEVCNLVFEKMSEPQNANINLIIIINKCDDMDPDRQIVRKGYKPVQDEIVSFLNESFVRFNIDESRVRIVLYSSLNVYHFRLIRHNTYEYIKLTLDKHDGICDEDEDSELTTIMGNIVGRENWLKMSEDDKRSEIEKLKSSPNYDENYIKKFGFFQLRRAINDFLSPEILARFFKRSIDQTINNTLKMFEHDNQQMNARTRYDCAISIVEAINRINISGMHGFDEFKKSMIDQVVFVFKKRYAGYVFKVDASPLTWFEEFGYLQKFEDRLLNIYQLTSNSISFAYFKQWRQTFLDEQAIAVSERIKYQPHTDEVVKNHVTIFRKVMEEYIIPSQNRYSSFIKEEKERFEREQLEKEKTDRVFVDSLMYEEYIEKFITAFSKPYLWNDKITIEWLKKIRYFKIEQFLVDYINKIFSPGTGKYCHYIIRVLQTLQQFQQNEPVKKLIIYAESKKASLLSQSSYNVLTLEEIDQYDSSYKSEIGAFLEEIIRPLRY